MIGGTDSILAAAISEGEFEITEVNECPVCSEVEEKESLADEVEFRRGMEYEPDDFYSEGEEGEEVFYMKQIKVCSVCNSNEDGEDVFEEEDDEDEEEVFDDF